MSIQGECMASTRRRGARSAPVPSLALTSPMRGHFGVGSEVSGGGGCQARKGPAEPCRASPRPGAYLATTDSGSHPRTPARPEAVGTSVRLPPGGRLLPHTGRPRRRRHAHPGRLTLASSSQTGEWQEAAARWAWGSGPRKVASGFTVLHSAKRRLPKSDLEKSSTSNPQTEAQWTDDASGWENYG